MSKLSELKDYRELLAEELDRDPEFRAKWERLAVARAIATIVTRRRTEMGLSQTALAKIVGVSQPVIARVESAEHNPTLETLVRLANALDIELELTITPAGRTDATRLPSNGRTRLISEATVFGSHLVVSAA